MHLAEDPIVEGNLQSQGVITDIYGYEGLLTRDAFCTKVQADVEWIFNDSEIRERMRNGFTDAGKLDDADF